MVAQWMGLLALSAAVTLGLETVGLPAAWLIGPMIGAIALGVGGASIRVPPSGFTMAQASGQSRPHPHSSGRLDAGVDAEADDGDQPSPEAGRDRDGALDDVVGDGEPCQLQAAPCQAFDLGAVQEGLGHRAGDVVAPPSAARCVVEVAMRRW